MLSLEKYKDSSNVFKNLWSKYENPKELPKYFNKIIEVDFNDFRNKVFSNDPLFAETLVKSLLNGDVYLLKNAFEKDFLNKIKLETVKSWKLKKSEFHKIYDKCPNFYRNITQNLSSKYAFKQIKQTNYFFPWNKDFHNLYLETYKRWRVIKYLSGFYEDVWENNIPSDGVIDRIQIVRYPPNTGELELHQDPYLYQKFFLSVYLTKIDIDYKKGGMYFIKESREKFEFEKLVEVGDMSFGFGTIYHGVDVSEAINDEHNDASGRWFMGLYSTVSDYENNRHTGKPAKIKIR